jgi:hypothetical protein
MMVMMIVRKVQHPFLTMNAGELLYYDQKGQEYANEMAGRLLKSAVDPKTGKLNANRLRSIKAFLNEVRSQRKQQKRDLSLESDCDDVLDEIKTKVKGWIESLLKDILTDLVVTLGTTSSAFNDLTSSIYDNSFDSSSSALIMPIGLVNVLDPWSTGSALQTTMSAIVDVFQLIVGYLIYGCDVFDDSYDGTLSSLENNVPPSAKTAPGTTTRPRVATLSSRARSFGTSPPTSLSPNFSTPRPTPSSSSSTSPSTSSNSFWMLPWSSSVT